MLLRFFFNLFLINLSVSLTKRDSNTFAGSCPSKLHFQPSDNIWQHWSNADRTSADAWRSTDSSKNTLSRPAGSLIIKGKTLQEESWGGLT